MIREEVLLNMLASTAKVHHNIALILEAKADEAGKMRSWLCNHIAPGSFGRHEDELRGSLGIHDQVIEVLDGLVKMSVGLNGALRAVVGGEPFDQSGDDAPGGEAGIAGR